MDIYDIRRSNFRRLLEQVGGSRERLASMMGWAQVNLVARYISESPKTAKTIGSALARRLEQKFHKPAGWMDSMNISLRAWEFAQTYDVLPEERKATVDGVMGMALPAPEPPTALPPAAPPQETQKRRKK